MLRSKLLFSLSSFIIFIRAGFIEEKLFDDVEVHLDRFDTRCRGKNIPYQTLVQGVKTISTNLIIRNYTLLVKDGGFKQLLLNIIIERCGSKENLDTCEEYVKQSNINYCNAMNPGKSFLIKNPLYVPFVPSLKCPVDKGTYHAYNFTIALAPFMLFKVEGWYWKVKYEVVIADQNKLAICIYMQGYFTNSKSKKV